MPARRVVLAEGETYHIVNRGVGSIPIFKNNKDYKRFVLAFSYYQHVNAPPQMSTFVKFPKVTKEKIMAELRNERNYLVEVIAFCLMPNHYHFLLKQVTPKGITNFIRLATNSYSKYFNIKYERKGTLFEGRFKAIRVETEQQLLHLSRYIHLNPYSGFVVKNIQDLLSYPHSSLPEYLDDKNPQHLQKDLVLSQFKNRQSYKDFVTNQADYQRNLQIIKHQLLEK